MIITQSTDTAKVVRRLKRHEVVSFDIFDTLITRIVPLPHDVFSVVEREYNRCDPDDKVSGFREHRVAAERQVRQENDFKEVSFEMIYARLAEAYGPGKARRLMETELEVEYKLSIKHRKGFEIFRAAKAAELRIVLASDMYLPKNFIGKLLAKHGITGYSDLFVSSDSLCMKSDGTLFDLIHRRLDVRPNKMIHIGDNFRTDCIQALNKRGTTYWMHPDLKQVEDFASMSEKSDVASVLERLGMRESVDQAFLDRFSLSLNDKVNGTRLSQNQRLAALYDEIKPRVIERSRRSYEALVAYLKKFELSGKIGVVDIGWNGSMQRALSKILESAGIDAEVNGYYFGVNPTSAHAVKYDHHYHGYLFEQDRNYDNFIKEECFRNVFETLFLARHGSVREIHGNGEIEMYDYEYEGIADSISALQKCALRFVSDYAECLSPAMVDPAHKCYHSAIFKMGLIPTRSEAKYFGDMQFFDVGLEYVAKVDSANALRGLSKAKWKTGYLVNLTGASLPYHRGIEWLIRRKLK